MTLTTWQPNDNQIVQMLVNRGYLGHDQVLFTSFRQLVDGAPSLLRVLEDEGHVDAALIARVCKEARQDAMVRQLVQEQRTLTHRQIAEANAKQRGTQRTFLQTLLQEAICSRATLRGLLSMVTDHAAAQPAIAVTWMSPQGHEPQHIA